MADTPNVENLQRFTPEELAQYDGKDGRRAYIAYLGKVYDVTDSRLWRNGVHVRAHKAGEDLSAAMPAAPHDDDVMEGMQIVGRLIDPSEQDEAEEEKLPWFIGFSLDHHLHPIAVHFPTGLGAVSAVFSLASLAFQGSEMYGGLQSAAFWTLVVCLLGSIPSVLTGWISWYFNYSAVWTPIYRIKWWGSGTLILLCLTTLALKFAALGGTAVAEPAGVQFWIYNLLLVLVAANVVVLGHFGGKITFPS